MARRTELGGAAAPGFTAPGFTAPGILALGILALGACAAGSPAVRTLAAARTSPVNRSELGSLLDPQVAFARADAEPARGADAVTRSLASLGAAFVAAPLDESRGAARAAARDGSMLFARESESTGRVRWLLWFPPAPTDDGERPAPDEVLRAYMDAWNAPEEPARRALLERCFAPEGRYADPQDAGTGPAEVSAVIARFRSATAGAAVTPLPGVQTLPGGYFTFRWRTGATEGFDVGQRDETNRIAWISGFFAAR